jgi:uracil-DNA glycosylase family 4
MDERRTAILRELGLAWWPGPTANPERPEDALPQRTSAEGPAATGVSLATGAVPSAAARRPTEVAPLPASVPSTVGRGSDAQPPPRPTHVVAELGWEELQAAVAACRACTLCDSRRQTVFGVGHRQAQWMVVGEAPGEQEDLRGEPFVGAAGQLLDAMLRSIGLTRAETAAEGQPSLAPSAQVYIANTLKCRPPRNRNPEPNELRQCEPFLIRQIELLRPRVILAMGRFAVQALLRTDDAIGRLRGRVHRYQGVPLIVTYHPAYLLRNLPDKARAWEDLCLAMATAESGSAGG